MSRPNMDSEDVKQLGHTVGITTGILGYFTGAFGAWAFWVITQKLDGQNPYAKGSVAHPSAAIVIGGAAIGIFITMVVTTAVVWRLDYYPKRFRIGPNASGSIALGLTQGVGMALTGLLVMIYALTMMAMWFLGAIFLLGALLM